MITREFNLVINAGTSSPLIINANQNDSGESWIFNLFQEDGTKVIPAAGEIVGLKADGHAIVNAGTVNESGQVVITETEQMTAAPGANLYEIVFDSVHGTANFILYVEKSPVDDDADFSESDISAINQAIAMAIDSATVQALQNKVNTETSERKAADNLLQTEIDQIIAPSGEAPSAAEVENARIGADGTVYDTLGNAIRGQVSDLNHALSNLTDIDVTWKEGYRLAGNGEEVSGSDWYITDFIELRDDIIYQLQFKLRISSSYQAYAVYDSKKTFIENYFIGTSSFAPVEGVTNITNKEVKYIRFCSFDDGGKHSVSISALNNLVLKDNFVTSNMIVDKNITLEKCAFAAHDPDTNYVNTNKVVSGYYVQANGTLKSDNGYAATDYCEVKEGDTLYAYHLLAGYCAFYDSSKTLIVGYGYGEITFPITVPNGAVYARFSSNIGWWPDTSQIWLFTKNEAPNPYALGIVAPILSGSENTNPCDYSGNEITVFNKILCIGDSLTAGVFNHTDSGQTEYSVFAKYAYPAYLEKLTGIETTNLGNGGYTSAEWYQAHANDDLSGYDCAIIQLGVNDTIRYQTFGETSQTAFTNIINKLKSENNNIKIFVANIIPAISYSSQAYLDFSTALSAWIEQAYGNDANVTLLDMQANGHTKDSNAYNAGHLTALGYYKLASDYKAYISHEISQNIDNYKFVQFIGTTYSYS